MKKIVYVFPAIALVFLLITGFNSEQSNIIDFANPEANLSYPDDIQEILDQSCYGCHNSESKNDKGKKKLMFDKIPELSKAKVVAKLGDIAEVIEKNEMPPEIFLEKFPDNALTEDQAKRLKEWAESTADEMMN